MKTTVKALAISAILVGFTACFAPQRTVERIDTNSQTDLSGRWNDTDSRLTADAIIDQILGDKWLTRFENAHDGKRPVMIVGLITNKSHEHIDAEMFIKDIEKAIIRNGSVRLVQAGDKRNQLRGERDDQNQFSSKETAKKWGKELGADYILQGTINSIVDNYDNKSAVTYQVDLELTDLETNEIVWMGDKKIKKFIKN